MKKSYNKRIFTPFLSADGIYYCAINHKGRSINLELDSDTFELEYKSIMRQCSGTGRSNKDFNMIKEDMRLDAYNNKIDYKLETRIFNLKDGSILYRLDREGNISVWLHDGIAELAETPEMLFKECTTLHTQVEPNLEVDETMLPKLLKRHFHLKDKDILLLSLYLVVAFSGNQMGHPILMLNGSKGSGKSQVAREIASLVDPQDANLVALQGSNDDFALRLYNNYIVVFDNVQSIPHRFVSLLAMAVTNGAHTKRKLFKNTEEVLLNVRSLIILTGIDIACRENDILDRSILITLDRLSPESIMSEASLYECFAKDKPDILGCCFKLLAKALIDDEPVTVPKTRVVDAFELMIRVGRGLGYEDEFISDLLWENQSKINGVAILDDVVGECILEYMETQEEFQGSVTELLNELREVAGNLGIDKGIFPKQPNALSRKLNAIKSNLEQEFGLCFSIKNTGKFRQITIWWEKE